MKRLFDWVKDRFLIADSPPEKPLRVVRMATRRKPPARPAPVAPEKIEFSSDVGGKITDGGPGKNVLVRNKYVREETGTHETLKIVDDSILESDDQFDADPYNTGRFDRSKTWDASRFRK